MDDDEIILLIGNSPSKGIYQALKKYRGYAGTIAGRVLRGRTQDIEECTADAFVSVWKYINCGKEIRNLKGFIAYAVRNNAINRLKKLKRENSSNISSMEIASNNDIILDFENENNAVAIQSLVYEMDEPDREIFVRKYFLLESVKEISRKTLLDEMQIKNRLYRGRQKLRKQIEERDECYESIR